MQNEAEISTKTAIPLDTATAKREKKASVFSLGASLGQGSNDLGTAKVTIFFELKVTQKITEHSWSSQTSYKNASKFENDVTDINGSGICFRKRMKCRCVTKDNNKSRTSSS